MEALKYLESQTDAKGRRLEVVKMPCPPPLHISKDEANGVAKVAGSMPREVEYHALHHSRDRILYTVIMLPEKRVMSKMSEA